MPHQERKMPKKLSERGKFHKFYHEKYLKDVNLNEPHHPDAHGMLGYETNTYKKEVQTVSGEIEYVAVNGLCEYCTIDRPSAKEVYDG